MTEKNKPLKLTKTQEDIDHEIDTETTAEERLAHAMLQRYFENDRKKNDAQRINAVIASINEAQTKRFFWQQSHFQTRLNILARHSASAAAIVLLVAGLMMIFNQPRKAMALEDIIKNLNLGERTFLIEVEKMEDQLVSMDKEALLKNMPEHFKKHLSRVPEKYRDVFLQRYLTMREYRHPAGRLDGASLYMSDNKFVISYALPEKFCRRFTNHKDSLTNKPKLVRGFDGLSHWMVHPFPKHGKRAGKEHGRDANKKWHGQRDDASQAQQEKRKKDRGKRNAEHRELMQEKEKFFADKPNPTPEQKEQFKQLMREKIKTRIQERMQQVHAGKDGHDAKTWDKRGRNGKRPRPDSAHLQSELNPLKQGKSEFKKSGVKPGGKPAMGRFGADGNETQYTIRQSTSTQEDGESAGPFHDETLNDVAKLLLIDLREMLGEISSHYDVSQSILAPENKSPYIQFKATRKEASTDSIPAEVSTFQRESKVSGTVLQAQGSPNVILINVDPRTSQILSITCQGLEMDMVKYQMSFIRVESEAFPQNWFSPQAHIPSPKIENKETQRQGANA